jgi:hypothetical protein
MNSDNLHREDDTNIVNENVNNEDTKNISPCGGMLEYLHLSLRFVESDEKGTRYLGV